MKFVCLQENLASALSLSGKITSGKNPLPVTTSTLLRTNKKGIEITATDLENTIRILVSGKVEKEGGILLPTRMCTEVVMALPKDQIIVEVEGLTARIKGGKHEAKISGIPATEFPELPQIPGASKIPAQEILPFIKQVSFAASGDESRAVLTGVLIIFSDTEVILVATDGYRLSLKKLPRTKKSGGNEEIKRIIIPAKIITEVARMVVEKAKQKEQDELLLAFDKEKKQMAFFLDGVDIFSRLIEGEYPAYEKIIPSGFETKAVFDRDEFLASVKLSSIFARESANIIKLKVLKDAIMLSANASAVGENTCEVEAAVEGEENEIAFNSRFLLEFLSNIDAKEIVFEMTGPLNPGVFKIPSDNSYLHIIMPVRVQG